MMTTTTTTTTNDTARRIAVIVSRELHVHLDQVTPEARLHEDLGADSIDVVGLIVDVEDELEVRIEDEKAIEAVRTVGDLVALAIAGGAPADATVAEAA